MDNDKIIKTMEVYQQIYFTHDEPVPFKDNLMVHPIMVKDYYDFFSSIDVFQYKKNEDPSGLGISMSNLDYLIHKSQQDNDDGMMVTRKIIKLFELIFHIKNGIICECDEDFDTYKDYGTLIKEVSKIRKDEKFKEEMEKQEDEQLKLIIQQQFINQAALEKRKCPKCGKERYDLIRYENDANKYKLYIGKTQITNDDFDLLRELVQYQNMPDYQIEDIDPEFRKELELKAELENKDRVQPNLEKQESCLVASTNYTYETIKELSVRHLSMLLKTVDSKLHYFTYKQAESSGFVTFKGELPHWIYSSDKKSKLDGVQTLDQLKEKLGNTTRM